LPGLSLGGPLSDRAEPSQSVTVKPSAPALAPRSTPLREARPSQATPAPPTGYIPPLHGTNPHGQGTAATIDLAPSPTRPLSGDPTGAGDPTSNREEIVLGRARGEQREDGRYHGHITILSLSGNEISGVDTNPGETRDGPLEPIQTGLLNPICTSSGGLICLELLRARSATTATSSENQFRAANVRLGGNAAGGAAVVATAAESNGNISSDGTCQTSHGDSTVMGLGIAVANAGSAPAIQAATSSTDSRACRGQAPTQTNTSDVITPNIAIPPILPAGCGSGGPGGTGTADTVGGIPVLLPIVCNADDTNGAQAGAPYGVREALAVFALVTPPDNALLKVTAAASESRAVAPAGDGGDGDDGDDGGDRDRDRDRDRGDRAGDRGAGAGDGGAGDGGAGDGGAGDGGAGDGDGAAQCEDGIDNDGDGKVDFPDDPQCSSSSDDSEADSLAFTGANLLLIVLMGAISLVVGLRLRRVANRPTPLA